MDNNIWQNLFGNRFINLGIHRYHIEHVLWHVRDIAFSLCYKVIIVIMLLTFELIFI